VKTTESRTRLFDMDGTLVADSYKLNGPGGIVNVVPLGSPPADLSFSTVLTYIGTKLLEMMPVQSDLPPYPYTTSERIGYFPDASEAIKGRVSATAWQSPDGKVVMTAAAPVQKIRQVMGVVMLTHDGRDIENAMIQVRFDVLTVFLGALSLTIFLSMYLAGLIGRPLKKLARSAEAIRQGKNRSTDIPDMSHRGDEIGELSVSLREMTQALWNRMDTIERFAADVAHEIKNPLTSLRSAVETVARVSDEKDRERLMEIIQLLESQLEYSLNASHTPPRSGDVRHTLADISKAKRMLGYLPKVDFPEGLRRTVEFFTAQYRKR
jgi:two-component system sensor histidine kinase ChvG